MFLPHLTISTFCDSYPALVESCFAPSKASNFWEQVGKDDPRLWDSPVAWEKANTPHQWQRKRQHTIPLWLYWDGVEFSTDSLLLFSFGGCLNGLRESQDKHRGLKQSHIIDNSFCLAAWPKNSTAKETWAEVFQALAWSFQSLWEGYRPQIDWKGKAFKGFMAQQAGKPLTKEGWRFYIWNYLGELEYYANTLKLPHWQRHPFLLALQLPQKWKETISMRFPRWASLEAAWCQRLERKPTKQPHPPYTDSWLFYGTHSVHRHFTYPGPRC